MPACTTPELWPVWWAPTRGSFSQTVTVVSGRRRASSRATASPTMPAPTTPKVSTIPRTVRGGSALRVDREPVLDAPGHGLRAGGDADLAVGRADVGLHRVDAQV